MVPFTSLNHGWEAERWRNRACRTKPCRETELRARIFSKSSEMGFLLRGKLVKLTAFPRPWIWGVGGCPPAPSPAPGSGLLAAVGRAPHGGGQLYLNSYGSAGAIAGRGRSLWILSAESSVLQQDLHGACLLTASQHCVPSPAPRLRGPQEAGSVSGVGDSKVRFDTFCGVNEEKDEGVHTPPCSWVGL